MSRRATFLGRWQPPHSGHDWLIRQALDKGEPVQILVRDIPPDDANPLTTEQTCILLGNAYAHDDVVIRIVEDVSAIHYGRGVGYGIIEHVPPDDVAAISATDIRRRIAEGDDSWRSIVLPGTADLLEGYLT